MIGKNEIYELLKNNNVWREITEHCAVFNMQELERIDLPYADCDAKNLFVKAQNGKGFYLITVKGNKKSRFECVPQKQRNAEIKLCYARRALRYFVFNSRFGRSVWTFERCGAQSRLLYR